MIRQGPAAPPSETALAEGPACPPLLAGAARAPAGGPGDMLERPRPGARREPARGGEDEVLRRIGLIRPSERTPAGDRSYDVRDLDRLQQVLVYRELGFPLEEVATLLDDPHADPAAHLRRQHWLLRERLARTQALVAAVEKEMEVRQMGVSLTPEERFEVFGDWLPEEYAAIAAANRRSTSSPSALT